MKRKIYTIFTIVALLIMLMTGANTLFKNDVHQWRYNGKCMDCHSQHSDSDNVKKGLVIPPPKSHTDQFRRYTHGKKKNFSYKRCSSCHLKSECSNCHNILPESHSSDFVKPSGIGMKRHIILATINPSSCLTCHKSFVSQCTNCHTVAEVKPWEEQGIKKLIKWNMYK